MLAELLLAVLLGIIFGTFTGLAPGIHINLVGAALVSLSASILAGIQPLFIAALIASMAITHTFLDFVPSVFLGCPDSDTGLSVLPGHEMLKNGKGYEAVMLTVYGGVMALIILAVVSFPIAPLIEKVYGFLKAGYIMSGILIAVSLVLVMSEKRKMNALIVLLLTGALGICVLNMQNLNQPLLPLLTGLFGSSSLIISLREKVRIPPQEIKNPKLKENSKSFLRAFAGTLVASPICGFLPGLGSGEAAVIGTQVSRTDRKGFMILLGATNTLVMGLSFVSLYAISKTRTGAAAAINDLLGNFSWKILLVIIAAALIAGLASFFTAKFFAKFFSRNITRINYSKISVAVLLVLFVLVGIISGILGLAILITSTLTGIYCINSKVKRTNMMGCLLIQTIILYLA